MPKLKDDEILYRARNIIRERLVRDGDMITAPKAARKYLDVLVGGLPYEIFGMLTLDNRNHVLKCHEIFRGTLDGCSVYPRELAKLVLDDGAAGVILFHNHPSGNPEPSAADQRITEHIKKLMELLDVKVLDHIIIGRETYCFSDHGLI